MNSKSFEIDISSSFDSPEISGQIENGIMRLKLKDPNQNYALKLNDNHTSTAKIKKLIIEGKNNHISLLQGSLRTQNISIRSKSLSIEKEFSLETMKFECESDKVNNSGLIKAEDLSLKAKSVINHPTGKIQARNTNLVLKHFIDKGTTFIAQLNIKSHAINLFGHLAVISADLKAKKLISFNKGSTTEFFEQIYCEANVRSVIINGSIKLNKHFFDSKNNSGNLICKANHVYLNSDADLRYCKKININASRYFKADNHSQILGKTWLTVNAPLIAYNSRCSSSLAIELLASDTCILSPQSILTSKKITLSGKSIYKFGQISGNLEFVEPIHFLYLASSASIKNTKNLEATAIHITHYGAIQADIAQLSTYHSIMTNSKSKIKANETQINSNYADLSGLYQSKKLTVFASTINPHDIIIETQEPTLINGEHLNLHGAIDAKNSTICFAANTIINNAILQHFQHTQINAEQTLITLSGSSIDTKTSEVNTETFHHHGNLKGQNQIVFKIKNSTHIGDTGTLEADYWHSESTGELIIAGSISVNQFDVQNHRTLYFIKNPTVSAKMLRVRAGRILGEVNLNVESGILASSHETRIFSGNIESKQDLVFQSDNNHITAKFRGNNFQFIRNKDSKNTRLHLSPESVIECVNLSSNHDSQFIAANIRRSDTILLDGSLNITIPLGTKINNDKLLCAKTNDFTFGGNINGTTQSDVIIESQICNLLNQSFILCNKLQSKTNNINLFGRLLIGDLNLLSKTANYHRGSITHAKRQIINLGTDQSLLSVHLNLGARVHTPFFAVNKSRLVVNETSLRANQIFIQTQHLENAISGQLGNQYSYQQLISQSFHHLGTLEAKIANIKCSSYFLQDGFNGIGKIHANQLNLTTCFYFNFFGTTEAQQAAMLSYVSVCLGLDKINFGYSNTFILIKVLPTIPDFYFLSNWADDLRNGNINLLDPNYLQYVSPIILKSLELFDPLVSLATSFGLNSYFLLNSLERLREYSKEEMPNQAVDWLPILLTIKNACLATCSLTSDFVDLGKELKIEIPKWINDYILFCTTCILMIDDALHASWRTAKKIIREIESLIFSTPPPDDLDDLFDDPYMPQKVKDLRDKKSHTKKEDEHLHDRKWLQKQIDENKHKQEKKIEKQKKEDEKKSKKNEEAKTQLGYNDLTRLEQVEQFFEKWIIPTLVLIAPRCIEDSGISIHLFAPAVLAFCSQRDLFCGISIYSPDVGVVVSKQSFGNIYCYNTNIAYSLNLSGHHVYAEAPTFVHILNVHADDFDIVNNEQIDVHSANLDIKNLKPLNIKAVRLYFKPTNITDLEDFLRLKGRWEIYANDQLKSVTYDINQPLTIQHSFSANWSHYYIAPKITLPKHTTLKSKNVVGLRSTEEDLKIYGKFDAKVVIKNSAKNLIQKNSKSNSEYLYDSARFNIDYENCSIRTVDGNITSDLGRIYNAGSHVRASRTMHIDAIRNQVIVTYIHHKNQKGVFAGGHGYGHDCKGLIVHAGTTVINDSSEFSTTEGDAYILGDLGLTGLEHHHLSVHKNNWKINLLTGVTTHEQVVTMKINKPIFKSQGGSLYLITKFGALDITCGSFRAKNTLYYYSFLEPNFRKLEVKSISVTQKSFLFGIELSNTADISNESISQHIRSPHLIVFELRKGDLNLLDTTLNTEHLITIVPEGKTYIGGTPVDHQIWSRFLNFGVRVGPIQYTHNTNPYSKKANNVSMALAPYNNFQAAIKSKSALEAGSHLINAATSSASAVDECSSVGVSLGYNESRMHYQAPSPYYLRIGRWDDYSCEVFILGMSGCVYRLHLHEASQLRIDGALLSYSQFSQNCTVGLNYHFLTNTVSGSMSGEQTYISGRHAAISQLSVHELYCDYPLDINLHNARLYVHSLHGTIRQVNLYTDYSDFTQSSISGSYSSQGDISANYHRSESHEIPRASEFRLDNSRHGQVLAVNSDGGKISGTGIKTTTQIQQTPNNSWHNDFGIGFSWNTKSKQLNSANYQNSSDEYHRNLEKTENGVITVTDQVHHGISIHIDIPNELLSSAFNNSAPTTSSRTTENIINNENNPKRNNIEAGLRLPKNYLSPETYAGYFDILASNSENSKTPQPQPNQNQGLPYHSPYDLSHYGSSFNVLNSLQTPLALISLSRFNYPIGDYIIGSARGIGHTVKGAYQLTAAGVRLLWDIETVKILQPWHDFFPSIITDKMIETSSHRLQETKAAMELSAQNAYYFTKDLALFYFMHKWGSFLPKNDSLQHQYNLTSNNILNAAAPLLTKITAGFHWFLFEATGPEIAEQAIGIFGPAKFVSKLGEAFNMYRYGTKIKPNLYAHSQGITEAKPLGKIFTIDEILNDEFNQSVYFVIDKDAKLLISDKKIELPFVMAAGEIEIDSGWCSSLLRVNKLFKNNLTYFPTDKHVLDLLRFKFEEFGFKSAINNVGEHMISFTQAELRHAPPVIHSTSWINPNLMRTYSAWQTSQTANNADWLTPSRPWSYPIQDYARAMMGEAFRILIEPYQLTKDSAVITVNTISPFPKFTFSESTYRQAVNHLTHSTFAGLGRFIRDALTQYALVDMLHGNYDEDFLREYHLLQEIQNQRINQFTDVLNMFLFYESGPNVLPALAQIVIPSAAIKSISAISNYSKFGMFAHPPKFNPISPKSEFAHNKFVQGTDDIKNYFLTREDIRTNHDLAAANYVITEERELRIVDQEITEHPMISDFQPVYAAGEVLFEEGKIYEINEGSGNYQPYGNHLEKLVIHIFKKHGFEEAAQTFDHHYYRFPSENTQITKSTWQHHLAMTFFFTLDDQQSPIERSENNANYEQQMTPVTQTLSLHYQGPYDVSHYRNYFNVLNTNQHSLFASLSQMFNLLAAPGLAGLGWSIYKTVLAASQQEPDLLYRGDARKPHEEIFQSGFEPQGNNRSIKNHIFPTEEDRTLDSAYISSSSSRETAKNFPHHSLLNHQNSRVTWVYAITKPKNAIDATQALIEEHTLSLSKRTEHKNPHSIFDQLPEDEWDDVLLFKEEREWLLPEKVDPTTIKGAWPVTTDIKQIDNPSHFENLGFDKEIIEELCYDKHRQLHADAFIPNPNYIPINVLEPQMLGKICKSIGHSFLILGVLADAYHVYHEIRLSQQTGDFSNTHRILSSIFAGWGMAAAFGAASAKAGIIICSPIEPFGPAACGVLFGLGGGIAGYAIGSIGMMKTYDSVQPSNKQYSSSFNQRFFAPPSAIEYPNTLNPNISENVNGI